MSGFKMNPNWERELAREIDKGVRKMGQDLERALNGLTPTYKGRPLPEVKTAVSRTWVRSTDGGSITDPELTTYAETIRGGARIIVRYEGLRS